VARANHKGRAIYEQYIKLHRGVTNSDAWKSLKCEVKCLVLLIWERHNGLNNGKIPLSHREARKALGIGNNKTTSAFKMAQDLGFIIERSKGSFHYKTRAGEGKASEWEITAESCDGEPAKHKYRSWKNKTRLPVLEPQVTTSGTD
jgi:hypothetical protein